MIGLSLGLGQIQPFAVDAAPVVAAVTDLTLVEQAGDTVSVTYVISADSTCEALIYLATETTPTAADFDGGGAVEYIDLGPVDLTVDGGDIDIALPDDLDGSYQLALLPAGGGDSDVAESNAATIDTTPPILIAVTEIVNHVTGSYGSGRSFLTVDLSGQVAGTDILVLFHDEDATSATLGGASMTHLTSGSSYAGGVYARAFVYTLASDGTAGTSLHVFHTNTGSSRGANVYAIVNGTVDEAVGSSAAASAGASLTVTPTAANNVILALSTVESTTITATWTGVTETSETLLGDRMTSFARADGVPVAAFNATTTLSASADWGAVLVSISEAT